MKLAIAAVIFCASCYGAETAPAFQWAKAEGEGSDKLIGSPSPREDDWTPPSVTFVPNQADYLKVFKESVTPGAASAGSLKLYRFSANADHGAWTKLLESKGLERLPATNTATRMIKFFGKSPVKGAVLAIAVGEGLYAVLKVNDTSPNIPVAWYESQIRLRTDLTAAQKIEAINLVRAAETERSRAQYRRYYYAGGAAVLTFVGYLALKRRRILR